MEAPQAIVSTIRSDVKGLCPSDVVNTTRFGTILLCIKVYPRLGPGCTHPQGTQSLIRHRGYLTNAQRPEQKQELQSLLNKPCKADRKAHAMIWCHLETSLYFRA
eukprot:1712957-Amphidinium_carterae.1